MQRKRGTKPDGSDSLFVQIIIYPAKCGRSASDHLIITITSPLAPTFERGRSVVVARCVCSLIITVFMHEFMRMQRLDIQEGYGIRHLRNHIVKYLAQIIRQLLSYL